MIPEKAVCVGNVNSSGNGMNGNVFDADGLSPTLTTNKGEGSKIAIKQATKKGYIECEIGGVVDMSYPNSKTRRGRVQEGGSVSPTITAESNGLCRIEPCIAVMRGRNPNNPSDRTAGAPTEQRLEIGGECSNTLTTVQKDNMVVEPNVRVRKLTPKECWRLMGFDDADHDRAAQVVSDSQRYKQAGNSIVVDVLMGIFKQML